MPIMYNPCQPCCQEDKCGSVYVYAWVCEDLDPEVDIFGGQYVTPGVTITVKDMDGHTIASVTPESQVTSTSTPFTGIYQNPINRHYPGTPVVTFSGGDAARDAVGVATLNDTRDLIGVEIIDGGAGYKRNPTLTVSGGGGPTVPCGVLISTRAAWPSSLFQRNVKYQFFFDGPDTVTWPSPTPPDNRSTFEWSNRFTIPTRCLNNNFTFSSISKPKKQWLYVNTLGPCSAPYRPGGVTVTATGPGGSATGTSRTTPYPQSLGGQAQTRFFLPVTDSISNVYTVTASNPPRVTTGTVSNVSVNPCVPTGNSATPSNFWGVSPGYLCFGNFCALPVKETLNLIDPSYGGATLTLIPAASGPKVWEGTSTGTYGGKPPDADGFYCPAQAGVKLYYRLIDINPGSGTSILSVGYSEHPIEADTDPHVSAFCPGSYRKIHENPDVYNEGGAFLGITGTVVSCPESGFMATYSLTAGDDLTMWKGPLSFIVIE
jgi:hypothetical protein